MKKILYFICIPFIIILTSCNKIETENEFSNHENDKYVVSLNEAIQIASDLNGETTKATQKTIGLTESITRGGNTPYFHIITYKEGGFAVIAGDKRVSPLMAYSDVSNFSFDESQYPPYLAKWMDNAVYAISLIRENNSSPDPGITSQWYSVPETRAIKPFTPDLCQFNGQLFTDYQVLAYGRSLSTTWGQGVGYNDALTNMNCSSYSNGRPPAGCTAVAIGQLMKYYNYPTTKQWNQMPDNTGSQTIAQLLAELGIHLSMNYSCDGSGSNEYYMVNTLRDYGYSSNSFTYGNADDVQSYMIRSTPVIFVGSTRQGRHAWICDGMKIHTDYKCITATGLFGFDAENSERKYLRMNWGWNGKYDAYYLDKYFNPGQYLFDTNLILITAAPNR